MLSTTIILTVITLFGRSFADYYVSILPTEAAINGVAGGTEGRLSEIRNASCAPDMLKLGE